MRTEKEIRDKISELEEREKNLRDPAGSNSFSNLLRAQMRGLYFALGENYSIARGELKNE